MNRRDFLKTSLLATAAVAATPLNVQSGVNKPTVQSYQEIGKTGMKMSDISFGTGKLASPSMILRAIDRGINYFDTAPDYGSAERYIGQAMNKIQRDKIFIASKFCKTVPYPGHLPLGSKKRDYIASVVGSLQRMKTDYLDVCFVHAIGEMTKNKNREKKRLLDEEMLSAAEALKKAGKIRFLAVSSHGPNNMEDLMLEAVRSGHFDIIMLAFNFMKFPRVPVVIKEAKKRNIGVIAMKTLAGAKDMGLKSRGEAFSTAAFKWVLKHPEVDGLVITIKTVSHLDHYLQASGKSFTASDRKVLDQYARIYGKEYCRTGCDICEAGCSRGVEIANILRYQMYFKDYEMEKRAMEGYAGLRKNAKSCLSCEPPPCAGACPYGLPLKVLLTEAHKNLSFNV
jgi:predicted aldo/keto reductase-like oxidoreductase